MSLPATPPLWTPAQQSWLQAMGYTVFVDGSVEAATPEPTVELTVVPADARLAEPFDRNASRAEPGATEPAAVADRRPARSAPPPAAEESAAPRPGTRRPAVRLPDRLQIALLRASGCNPNDPDTQALMAGWNLEALRGNAAAKRALWPQLRALRKKARP